MRPSDEPSRAAGLDLLPEVLVVLHTGEKYCEVGADARQRITDGESVAILLDVHLADRPSSAVERAAAS
jgi:hypothetical protein